MPCRVTEPSVTIQSWSVGRGKVIDARIDRRFWAWLNCSRDVSDHVSLSADFRPQIASSRGAMIRAQLGRTRLKDLYIYNSLFEM